jgi:hypothetical protein
MESLDSYTFADIISDELIKILPSAVSKYNNKIYLISLKNKYDINKLIAKLRTNDFKGPKTVKYLFGSGVINYLPGASDAYYDIIYGMFVNSIVFIRGHPIEQDNTIAKYTDLLQDMIKLRLVNKYFNNIISDEHFRARFCSIKLFIGIDHNCAELYCIEHFIRRFKRVKYTFKHIKMINNKKATSELMVYSNKMYNIDKFIHKVLLISKYTEYSLYDATNNCIIRNTNVKFYELNSKSFIIVNNNVTDYEDEISDCSLM